MQLQRDRFASLYHTDTCTHMYVSLYATTMLRVVCAVVRDEEQQDGGIRRKIHMQKAEGSVEGVCKGKATSHCSHCTNFSNLSSTIS